MRLAEISPIWLLLATLLVLGLPLWLAETSGTASRLRRAALLVLLLSAAVCVGLPLRGIPNGTHQLTVGAFTLLAACSALLHVLTRSPQRASLSFLFAIAGTSGVLLCRELHAVALLNLAVLAVGIGMGYVPACSSTAARGQDAASASRLPREPALTSLMTCVLACALGGSLVNAVERKTAGSPLSPLPGGSIVAPTATLERTSELPQEWAENEGLTVMTLLSGVLAVSLVAVAASTVGPVSVPRAQAARSRAAEEESCQ